MLLIEVLKIFNDYVNQRIDQIGYLDDMNTFKILGCLREDDITQVVEVDLFGDGDTDLFIIETITSSNDTLVLDDTIKFYTTIKTQWSNYIASH